MEAAGLIEPVDLPRALSFNFTDVAKLPPPNIAFTDVSFSYSGEAKDFLYSNLNLGIDMDSRYVDSMISRMVRKLTGPQNRHRR